MHFDGGVLRELREAQAKSRERLAVDAGVSYQSILNYEAGRNAPHVSTLARLADALGVDPGVLFTADDPVAV